MTLTLRRMRVGEETRLYEVLRSAVLRGTASRYNEAQRRAWAPDRPLEGWAERLGMAQCFVAVVDGMVVGFMAVTPGGHVDLAYVVAEHHRGGIGGRLLERVETEMRMTGVAAMSTGASLVAAPFFERHGWRRESEEVVERNGQELRRVRMAKSLEGQGELSQAS